MSLELCAFVLVRTILRVGRRGNKMRILHIIGLLTLVSGIGLAQTRRTVEGKLTEGGRPFAHQEVSLFRNGNNATTVTRTDGRGYYHFFHIETGTYTIEYGRHKLTVFVTESGVEYSIVEEIVNVAASQEQTVEQVSKTVDTIDAQQMRDRTDFALVESLRTIPGFRVQQLGGFGRTANIKTRGLRNQDTAILIDGIRFRDPTSITGDATPFLSDITLTSVDSMEVLRGSGSSLYGTNAVGGVVDFQTPEAKRGTHGQIGGAFGGLGLGRFRGILSHGMNRFGITAGVSRTAYTKGIDGDDNAYNTNFQTRVDASPFSKTNISGRIFVSDAKVRLNSDPDTAGTLPLSNSTVIDAISNATFVPDINDPDKRQHSRFFSGQLVVNQVITSKLFINGYYQGLDTRRTNNDGPLGIGYQAASTSIYDGSIHTANAHLNWTPDRFNHFTIGYEWEKERFENDGRTPSGTQDFFTIGGQKSNTFYAQDLISLLDGDLQFAGGARVQRYSLKRPEFSVANPPYHDLTLDDPPTAYTFDGAASYFIRSSGTKLRTHVGNGYRVPSLYERFGSFYSTFNPTGPEFIIIGDPFLKPEKSIAFDAGIEQNLANDRVRLSATYFYTHLKDVINYGNVVSDIGLDPRPFGGYENQHGGISRGAEFSTKVRVTDSTDIFGSYTLTNSDQAMPQVSGSGIPRTLGVPDHQFTLVATQRYKRAWVNFDFLATSVYLAPIFDTNNFTFQTYVYRFEGNRRGDVTAGYIFGFRREKMNLRVYGTIENVFDQEYYENGFRTAGATGRIGMSFGF